MPATLIQKSLNKGGRKTRLQRITATHDTPLPQAGQGACRLCSCKKFVPESRFQLTGEGHTVVPCANCGHDIRQHAV